LCSIYATKYQNKPNGKAHGAYAGWERMNLLDIFTQSNYDNAFFVLFFKSPQKMSISKQTKSNFITDTKQIGENERSKTL
jgi:hypothetical protein